MVINNILCKSKEFGGKLTLPKSTPYEIEVTYSAVDRLEPKELNATCTKATLPFAASDVFNAKLLKSESLTSPIRDVKHVYEITLDIKNSGIKYSPGDTVGILPVNDPEEVAQVLKQLDLLDKSNQMYTIDPKQNVLPKHIPEKSTLNYLFSNCIDLRNIVKKLFLLELSKYTSNGEEKNCLELLSSKEGSELYRNEILNRKITLLNILKMFPSCKPSLQVLVKHLPRLLPRPYSVTSSQMSDEDTLRISFSVVTVDDGGKGIASGWLEKLIKAKDVERIPDIEQRLSMLNIRDDSEIYIPMYMRLPNKFRLPVDNETPILMIGPGTGVAPFIGFLEHRQHLKKMDPNIVFGFSWIFFGCRFPDKDFIYEARLNEFLNDGTLDRLTTSFSRCDVDKYVQNKVRHHGEEVVDLIEKQCNIYICGDLTSMGKDVVGAVRDCLAVNKQITIEEADAFVNQLQKENRILTDVWI